TSAASAAALCRPRLPRPSVSRLLPILITARRHGGSGWDGNGWGWGLSSCMGRKFLLVLFGGPDCRRDISSPAARKAPRKPGKGARTPGKRARKKDRQGVLGTQTIREDHKRSAARELARSRAWLW